MKSVRRGGRALVLESPEVSAQRRLPEPMTTATDAHLRLALAGGGTGGHILPGVHFLAHVRGTGALEDLLWFQSGRPVEDPALAGLESGLEPVPVERVVLRLEPRGGGAPGAGRLLLKSLPETWRARAALRRHRSQVLLGLGGFTSLPAVLAAVSLGIPAALLEINAARGRATKVLAPLARRVFHAWRSTLPPASRGPRPRGRHRWVGPPLSTLFLKGSPGEDECRAARSELGFDARSPLLLVLGGSQGAGALNDFVRASAPPWVAGGLQVMHQVGPGRLAEGLEPRPGYRPVEFIADVRGAISAATLVLCRGGASTLAELGALCRPAWVVPYPHHPDLHQERNARELGVGVRIVPQEELGPNLARELAHLAGPAGRSRREAMAEALRGRVPVDGAVRLYEEILTLVSP